MDFHNLVIRGKALPPPPASSVVRSNTLLPPPKSLVIRRKATTPFDTKQTLTLTTPISFRLTAPTSVSSAAKAAERKRMRERQKKIKLGNQKRRAKLKERKRVARLAQVGGMAEVHGQLTRKDLTNTSLKKLPPDRPGEFNPDDPALMDSGEEEGEDVMETEEPEEDVEEDKASHEPPRRIARPPRRQPGQPIRGRNGRYLPRAVLRQSERYVNEKGELVVYK